MRILLSIFFLAALATTGSPIWYECQFNDTNNPPSPCKCDGDSCYIDYYQEASCSFVLFSSDCYLASGKVGTDRKSFWCLNTGPGGACQCDPSSPTGQQDQLVVQFESDAICTSQPG